MQWKIFLLWAARLVVAVLLIQTLYFKFSGASESVEIFTRVGMEPWGRWAVGIAELIAAVFILLPRYSGLGALLAFALMTGAIFLHLTLLGIEVQHDGGQLFFYALLVAACSGVVVLYNTRQLMQWLKTITS